MKKFLDAAIKEAKIGLNEGGIPIGSVLVLDGKIIGRGHNQRVQKSSVIRHAEMDCLENAGRLKAQDYKRATLYTTLSPCSMCTGAIMLYKIRTIIVGENTTFSGQAENLRWLWRDVKIYNDTRCIKLMKNFIKKNPELWNEDIGK